MYSFVSLLSGIYPLLAMHSMLVTNICKVRHSALGISFKLVYSQIIKCTRHLLKKRRLRVMLMKYTATSGHSLKIMLSLTICTLFNNTLRAYFVLFLAQRTKKLQALNSVEKHRLDRPHLMARLQSKKRFLSNSINSGDFFLSKCIMTFSDLKMYS